MGVADSWFNVTAEHCSFGATFDGCGGDGDEPVRLILHTSPALSPFVAAGAANTSPERGP